MTFQHQTRLRQAFLTRQPHNSPPHLRPLHSRMFLRHTNTTNPGHGIMFTHTLFIKVTLSRQKGTTITLRPFNLPSRHHTHLSTRHNLILQGRRNITNNITGVLNHNPRPNRITHVTHTKPSNMKVSRRQNKRKLHTNPRRARRNHDTQGTRPGRHRPRHRNGDKPRSKSSTTPNVSAKHVLHPIASARYDHNIPSPPKI